MGFDNYFLGNNDCLLNIENYRVYDSYNVILIIIQRFLRVKLEKFQVENVKLDYDKNASLIDVNKEIYQI